MQVKIKMMGRFKEIIGKQDIVFQNFHPSKVKDLINLLIENYPAFKNELLDPVLNSPIPNALIIVDGIEINNLNGINTYIKNGSHVIFLPVTHGG
jgi:molybdopterin converting factor small subunit